MSIAPVSGAGLSPVAAQGVSNNQPDPQLRAARQVTEQADLPALLAAGSGLVRAQAQALVPGPVPGPEVGRRHGRQEGSQRGQAVREGDSTAWHLGEVEGSNRAR